MVDTTDAFNMTYDAVTPQDIFDLYGVEYLMSKLTDPDDIGALELRVNEIHRAYLGAAKKRAGWILKQIGPRKATTPDSLRGIVDEVNDGFEAFVQRQLEKQRGGNMMGALIAGYQAKGVKVSDDELKQFGVTKQKVKPAITADVSKIGIGEWQEIAKAYIQLENAETTTDKILAVDHMNDMQHCGGNLLVDFQVGRRAGEGKDATSVRGEGVKDAVTVLKDILDLKAEAKKPQDFLDKMSLGVRKIFGRNRAFLR
jgi:hypothetical protein